MLQITFKLSVQIDLWQNIPHIQYDVEMNKKLN